MRATIRWSYDLLSPPGQLLFQRLSIFVGPFDLAAAEMVAADAALGADDVDDLLGELVTRSMLAVESGPFGQRFRLLETMRQFAAGQLAATGDTDLIAGRHARWCRDRVTHLQELLSGPAEVEGVARLDELWPNHRAAFDWACATNDRRLAHGLIRPVVTEIVRRGRAELGDWVERLLALTPPDDVERRIFALTWAAQRYKLGQDPEAYERLVERYGEPDHPLLRHARASVRQDYRAVAAWAAPAIAELRRRGEDDQAEQFELDVGAGLVLTEHFGQGDPIVAALVERYRTQGPPTLLHLSLIVLGYSASLQGRHDLAERRFGEAADVEVPDRTQSPAKPLQARAAFRRGDRPRAFAILSAYITELLDTGNMQATCITCVEFINMMAAMDRLADAAPMLLHLDKTFPYWDALVADARARIETGILKEERVFGDREALEYMRDILERLANG
jgi:hypothetical protein